MHTELTPGPQGQQVGADGPQQGGERPGDGQGAGGEDRERRPRSSWASLGRRQPRAFRGQAGAGRPGQASGRGPGEGLQRAQAQAGAQVLRVPLKPQPSAAPAPAVPRGAPKLLNTEKWPLGGSHGAPQGLCRPPSPSLLRLLGQVLLSQEPPQPAASCPCPG